MADDKNKKSFIIYNDWNELISAMDDVQAGQMFKAIFAYHKQNEVAKFDNPLLQGIFNVFKNSFDEDARKYKEVCEKRANSGSKGGQAKAENTSKSVANLASASGNLANVASASFAKKNIANVADNDNEYEHDSDNDLKDMYSRAGTTACIEPEPETVDDTKGEPCSEQPKKPKKANKVKADTEATEVIDYLNAKTGSSYRATTEANVKPIRARLNDGYTVEDCKKVIDTKSGQWLNDPDMSKYLRPETLFRPSRFEGYLNECRGKPSIRGDSPPISEQAAFNQSISEAIQRQMLEPVENPVTDEMLDALGIK